MRLMTYNILTGGLDADMGDRRWPHLVEVIRSVQPDVLVLNECNYFELNRFQRFHRMERALGMRGLFALAETGFHVAIFMRREVEVIEHGAASSVHHAMLEAKLVLDGMPITVVGVHLCPFGGQNRVAEAELLTRVAKPDEWVFIAGDMNAISRIDASRMKVDEWAARRQARHLFPGTREIDTRAMSVLEGAGLVDLGAAAGICKAPTALTSLIPGHESYRVRIDYVFGSERVAAGLRHAEVIQTEIAERASDHYPVWVDVELP